MAFVKGTHCGDEANCPLAKKEVSSVFPQRVDIVEDLSLWGGGCCGAERGGGREIAEGIVCERMREDARRSSRYVITSTTRFGLSAWDPMARLNATNLLYIEGGVPWWRDGLRGNLGPQGDGS
jgi:hypothetical protein